MTFRVSTNYVPNFMLLSQSAQRKCLAALLLSVMMSKNKIGCCSVGTFIKFVWATMGRKILNNDISAKEEDIEL